MTMGLFSISHNPSLKPFLFWGLPSLSLFFSYAKISLAARQYLKQTEVEITKKCEHKYRILGECLLISSLPGKALRTLVDFARLAIK